MLRQSVLFVSLALTPALVGIPVGTRKSDTPVGAFVDRKECSNLGGPSEPPTVIIDLPVCLDEPGKFTLDRDHCYAPGPDNAPAISVVSNGVEIDMDGHSVQLVGPNVVGATVADRSGATIKNGTFIGTQTISTTFGPDAFSQFGIFVFNGAHVCIEDMIFRQLGVGVNITKSLDVKVKSSFFEDGVTGIQAVAIGVGPDPTLFGLTDGVTIEDVHIRDMSQYGIFLRSNLRNVLIKHAVIDTIGIEGIFGKRDLRLMDNVTIDSTKISNTQGSGIFVEPLCRNWVVKNSQFFNNKRNGIVFNGPRNLEIIGCEIFESGLSGIFVGVRAANNVAICSTQINNAGEIPLRIDNTTNLRIQDTQVAQYVPSSMPVVRLVDVQEGIVDKLVITNFGENPDSDGLFIRGSSGVQMSNLTIESSVPSGPPPALLEEMGRALIFAGGNRNCTVQSSTFTGSGRGISVEEDTQFSGVNRGISIERNNISLMMGSGIVIDNSAVVKVVGNSVSECGGFGIFDNNGTNSVFSNIAIANQMNYEGVDETLIVSPGPNVGTLENITVEGG